MMVAASTLALGARGAMTEWGLCQQSAQDINALFDPLNEKFPTVSKIYLYVYATDGSWMGGDPIYWDILLGQLKDGTFDGTASPIVDCIMFDSPPPAFWEEVDYTLNFTGPAPTYFSNLPEGMERFGVVLLGELVEPLYGGETFIYMPMYTPTSWYGNDYDRYHPKPYFKDGVDYLWPVGDFGPGYGSFNPVYPIPEPATGLLALAGIALLIRRKRK